MGQLIIKVSKCTLVLEESELMKCMAAKPDIFQAAIRRGKGFLRAEKVRKWEEKQLSADDEK
jgi:hypothetical protein